MDAAGERSCPRSSNLLLPQLITSWAASRQHLELILRTCPVWSTRRQATSSTRLPYFSEVSWPGGNVSYPLGLLWAGTVALQAGRHSLLQMITSSETSPATGAQLPKAKSSQCPDQAPAHWPSTSCPSMHILFCSNSQPRARRPWRAVLCSVHVLGPRNTESIGAEAESCSDKLMWPFCEWIRGCVSCQRERHRCWDEVFVCHCNTSSTQPVA